MTGSLESSEEGALTPVCCMPMSNSPNFIVLVCVYVCACALRCVRYLSIKWQEGLLIFKIVSVLAFVISECKFKFIALCSNMFLYKLKYCT